MAVLEQGFCWIFENERLGRLFFHHFRLISLEKWTQNKPKEEVKYDTFLSGGSRQ
ncbi:hypothetical protein [Paenibacillus pabuli]|uniref:hypothetical protein n=1 Tax=Paenibacillus pabuli TaxID=1472 RepID=UPI0020001374|nr:hypothetical protein [Paenibacillus pabuli]UPK46602.1 hypothetical protein KET34_14720 [Paenibacillus pabuli]